jgi:outer membrane protein assembly factor BamA
MGAGVLSSCRSTKYVPDGQKLLARVEVKNSARDLSRSELESYIRQKENSRIFGFWKFHLGLYNLSGSDTSKGINKWLRRIGEEPVVFDPTLVQASNNQLRLLLNNRGYYTGQVTDTTVELGKHRVKVVYGINPGKRYRIQSLGYSIEDDSIRPLIMADTTRSLLKAGRPFDSGLHDQERARITKKIRDEGYFAFSKDYIYFIADSNQRNYFVRDSMIVRRPESSLPGQRLLSHQRYRYRQVIYQVKNSLFKSQSSNAEVIATPDTIDYLGVKIVFSSIADFHPSVLTNSSYIVPGEYFHASNVEKTQLLLNSLQLFRYVDVRFQEVEGSETDSIRYLDCFIQVIPARYQSYGIEVEGTNSSGNLGAAGNLKYRHRNLFSGAEVLDMSFRLAGENQLVAATREDFRTLETGSEIAIEFPKFLIPYKIESFRKRFNPKTTVSLAFNYQRRPDYTRTIANLRIGYNWRSSRSLTHFLYPSELNLVNIPKISDAFWNNINGTFLQYSYEDHFILNSNYSVVYNGQVRTNQTEFWFGRFYVEGAGNLLNGLNSLWKKDGSEFNEILGIRYAQYVKSDVDLRYHHALNKFNSFAYRFFAGVGYPYGNLKVLPFEKRYFGGGANGIRAWPVRGLGPGIYEDPTSSFYNQTADIKLELNAEYRFKLFWIFEGALFADAGNIWSIRKDASPEGGLFYWDNFYNQIAVGVGWGLRFDFDYFIFRLDMGLKARDPVKPVGQRWVFGSYPLSWSNTAFNFAIGYPF